MQRLKESAGTLVFFAGWPFFWAYFRIWSRRTRVIVIHDKRLLLVKGWLSDGSWGLPGGGAHKRELAVESAVRELQEETGVAALPSHIQHIADIKHQERRLKYTAMYFLYKPQAEPKLIRQKKEIADIGWFNKEQLKDIKLNVDARYSVESLVRDLL